MANTGLLSSRQAELNALTHERKVQKHKAKLDVSDIFLSASKHFQESKTQQTIIFRTSIFYKVVY